MNQEVSKIESYSKAFSEKVCNTFFSGAESINGEQIISLTPVDQVNLLVLKNLFQRWKEEMKKLKSPYFNYDSPEVKNALESFMNTISKNISIKKEFFRPLIEKAVIDSLLLLIKPSLYFKNEFQDRVTVPLGELREALKYFKLHKQTLEAFLSKLDSEGKSGFAADDLEKWMDTTSNPGWEEQRKNYFDKFYSVLSFEIVTESKQVQSEQKVQPEAQPNPETSVVNEVKKPVIEERKEQVKNQPVNAAILNEKFSATQLTLNDVLKQNQGGSLVEKINKGRIENIRTAISLSQKFLFVQSLFRGVSADYESALNQIDESKDYQDAYHVLSSNYATRYQWDFNSPEVKEFVEIVQRKFS
jgi:hypothetical protein